MHACEANALVCERGLARDVSRSGTQYEQEVVIFFS